MNVISLIITGIQQRCLDEIAINVILRKLRNYSRSYRGSIINYQSIILGFHPIRNWGDKNYLS